jgi:hypothetical protein
MRLRFLGLLVIAACAPVLAREDKEAERVEVLRKEVLKDLCADDPDKSEAVAGAYKKLFTHIGLAGLPKLAEDEDTSLALQAAWEVHRKAVKRNPPIRNRTDWAFDPKPMEEFLKIAAKRFKAEPPAWWSNTLLKGEVFPDRHHAFIDIKEPPAAATTVKAEKEDVVITSGKQSVRMSKAEFEKDADEFDIGITPVVLCEADLTFLARPGFRSYPFKLIGVDSTTGKRLWAATVWGARRGFSSGPAGACPVEIRRKGEMILVFGCESHGIYAEGFDAKTGKCQFRFCSCYWFNNSEAWGLK